AVAAAPMLRIRQYIPARLALLLDPAGAAAPRPAADVPDRSLERWLQPKAAPAPLEARQPVGACHLPWHLRHANSCICAAHAPPAAKYGACGPALTSPLYSANNVRALRRAADARTP